MISNNLAGRSPPLGGPRPGGLGVGHMICIKDCVCVYIYIYIYIYIYTTHVLYIEVIMLFMYVIIHIYIYIYVLSNGLARETTAGARRASRRGTAVGDGSAPDIAAIQMSVIKTLLRRKYSLGR